MASLLAVRVFLILLAIMSHELVGTLLGTTAHYTQHPNIINSSSSRLRLSASMSAAAAAADAAAAAAPPRRSLALPA